MEPEFWHQRWNEKQIGFHQQKVNSRLQRIWPKLNIKQGAQIFVPLCGKSLDMLWMANQGYQVTGVELSEIACSEFFTDNALPFKQEKTDQFTVFRGQKISLYSGDFFDLAVELLRDVQATYDRAALIALPESIRPLYAGKLAELLPAGCQVLLITMEYDQSRMEGPPFSVSEREIHTLFENQFSVKKVGASSGPEFTGNLRERGLDTLDEKIFQLVRRGD